MQCLACTSDINILCAQHHAFEVINPLSAGMHESALPVTEGRHPPDCLCMHWVQCSGVKTLAEYLLSSGLVADQGALEPSKANKVAKMARMASIVQPAGQQTQLGAAAATPAAQQRPGQQLGRLAP